jgi:streptogramin lyase
LNVDSIAARRDYNGPIFSDPAAIASSPTQPIWFTNSGRNTIGYLSSDNVPHELATRLIAQPDEMVAGPDGTIWFSETGTPAVGYVDTTKQIHEIDLHDEHGSTESWGPRSLVATNAAAWMVGPGGKSVVRAGTNGSFQRFDTSSASSWVRNLGVDGSGSIWFPTADHNSIARVTPDGLHVYGTTQPIVLLDHTQHVGHYIYFLASDKLMVAEIAGSSSGSTVVATAGNHGSLSPDDADGAWYADCSNKSLVHFLDGKDVGHLQLASDQCPRRVVGDGNGGVWFWTANPVRLDHIAGSGAVKVFEMPQNFQPASTVRSAAGSV